MTESLHFRSAEDAKSLPEEKARAAMLRGLSNPPKEEKPDK